MEVEYAGSLASILQRFSCPGTINVGSPLSERLDPEDAIVRAGSILRSPPL